MRLAIDVQACQLGGERGHRALATARALQAAAAEHELIWVARDGLDVDAALLARWLAHDTDKAAWRTFRAPLPSAAHAPANAWRRAASRAAWAMFLAGLDADAVIVLDAAVGYTDDAIYGAPDALTPPLVALVGESLVPAGRGDRVAWACEIQAALADAAAVIGPAGWQLPSGQLVQPAPADVETLAALALAAACRAGSADAAPARLDGASAKPRLAYVSPVPPAASGIADYSAELLPALAEHYAIELVCPEAPPPAAAIAQAYPVRTPAWFHQHAGEFDRILYHLGNSPFHSHMLGLLREHPGVVVLHDFYLGHVFGHAQHTGRLPMALWRALLRSHGPAALQLYRAQGEAAALAAYPCNLEIFAQADGVIVHSRHAESLARRWAGPTPPCPVHVVPLSHASPQAQADRLAARARLGLDADAFVACSFGYAGQAKMSRELVEAWIATGLTGAHLALVGGHQFEGEYSRALEARIREVPSGTDIRMTGYAPMSVYRDYLAAADVAIQLRTQSRGETSRAILDAMAHGVAVLANAHGAAAELPAETAMLLPDMPSVAEITHALRTLAAEPARRQAMAEAAGRHVRTQHDPAEVARAYRDAIESAAESGPRTPAGLARRAVKSLAGWREPLVLPDRAQTERLARDLLVNHPQPQSRGVPPDTAALLRRPRTAVGPAGLRVLSLRPARPIDARSPRIWRAQATARAMADAGVTWDVVEWAVGPMPEGGDRADTLRVPDVACASDVPRRLAQGLAALLGASQATGLAALVARLRATGYDAIHLETPFAWPLLQAAWPLALRDGPMPALIYEAERDEQGEAARHLPVEQADAVRQTERAVLAQAGLCLATSEALRTALVRQGAAPWRVVVVPDGAAPPQEDPARSHAVYVDHLPQRPFALWVSEDDAGARQGFLDLMGRSFAFLPPDAMLVVIGRLCDFIEQSPDFNAWGGINRSRVRLLADADELMLSGARRHAHVVLLARAAVPGDIGAPDAQAAEALRDARPVLARPAALRGLAPTCEWPALTVEPDMDRFRARLVAALRAPAPAVVPAPPVPWDAVVHPAPRRLAALVHGVRTLSNAESR
ncbi:glycosyltransferase [Achromobacter sp. GG226]|uniref:glycosyltransferase n=1 Tax=Verticiella alkaliphila TaxID=2779529 RepID=UPI001C0ACF11|nr:glycosyltransferase [Verticiella sp. GG226]MBU4612101.1 glycosyltransferase [Verticiella sp. GG226]